MKIEDKGTHVVWKMSKKEREETDKFWGEGNITKQDIKDQDERNKNLNELTNPAHKLCN